MSLSNTTENAVLKMFLQGTDPSYRAGATQYVALFTADPTDTADLSKEATYGGYGRYAITKASAWTDGGSTFSNSGLIQFNACNGAPANTISHFAIVDTASGAVNMMISGQLSSNLAVSSGIQPQFAAGALQISVD